MTAAPATPRPPAASPGQTATLLVLSAGEELAKRVESHLRNAGHPVRAAWVTDLEDMEDAIRRGSPDLVLCQEGQAKAPPRDVLTLCARLNPGLPVLLMTTRAITMADTVAALRIGMRGLVTVGDALQMQHLELICLRELGTYLQLRDLRRTRAQLADFEARHEKLLAGTGDAVLHVQEGIVTDANAAFAALLGHESPSALEGNPLMDLVAPPSQPQIKQFLKAFAQGKAATDKPLTMSLLTKGGETLKVLATVVLGHGHEGRLLELLVRPEEQASAAAPAPAAAPAGGGGRLELFPVLNQAIKANVGMHRALLMVAVDNFGDVEQRLGYHEAELALMQLTELVRRRLSPAEPIFRFSTALLAIIISRPSAREFETLADTLRQDVAAHLFKTESYEAQLTATVVSYPLSPTDRAIEVVDASVRETRKLSRDGGNRTAVLGPAAQAAQAAAVDQRKAEQIKRALAENRLKLAFQSIASLEGSDRHHFDVLARMLDESGQEVPARDFIPAAERFGLVVAIDRWVIARALTVLAKRNGATDTSSLFVRLSEQSVREGDALVRWLSDLLKTRPLKKEELVVAIQEPIVESHVMKAKALSQALRNLGAQMALDYYGLGNHSVKMVDHVAPQYVRFHYSFTKDINDAALQKKMAELMEAAKERSIKTIVGQVEDANAMARLWQMGANYIQGYHIQAPEAVLLATDVR